MSLAIPYEDQVEAIERELKLRERVYPRRVEGGQMTQALADREVARMRAVKATLDLVVALSKALDKAAPLDGAVVSGDLEVILEALRFKPADAGRLL